MEREQTTIRLPEELMKQLNAEADRKGMSFNEYVLIAINQYIQENQKK